MSDKPEKKPSFWGTFPGILTGVAAILTAVVALFVALNEAGIVASKQAGKETAVTPAGNETHGDNSPVITGDSNTITVNENQ